MKKELERSKRSQIDNNIYSNNILPRKNELTHIIFIIKCFIVQKKRE